jgi:hypothetical protein
MAYQTIKIEKHSDVIKEFTASGSILPGMLVELSNATTCRVHSTASGTQSAMFVLEDELQGAGIDTAIASGSKAQVWYAHRGDIVYALLKDEQNISFGDLLESDGEGRLQKHTNAYGDSSTYIYYNQIVGVALEAVNLSSLPEGSESSAGGTYYHPRILVSIL